MKLSMKNTFITPDVFDKNHGRQTYQLAIRHGRLAPTDLIVDWIKLLYYRKMKPISNGAKLLPVTTLQRKQYGVVLRNESTRRVYRSFGAFPSAGLNRALVIKRTKYFLSFGRKFE